MPNHRKRRGEDSPSQCEDSPRASAADMKRLLEGILEVKTQLSQLSATVCTKDDLAALRDEVKTDVAGVRSEVASVAARVTVLESRPASSGVASSSGGGGGVGAASSGQAAFVGSAPHARSVPASSFEGPVVSSSSYAHGDSQSAGV